MDRRAPLAAVGRAEHPAYPSRASRAAGWFIMLAAVALLPGCGTAPDRTNAGARLERIVPEIAVRPAWFRQAPGGVAGQYRPLPPLASEGRLYVPYPKGRIVALDAASGRFLWEVSLAAQAGAVERAARLSTAVSTGAGLLFAATHDGEVLVLAKEDGALRWRAQMTSEVLSPPVVAGDRVVVRTNDGKIAALRLADGERLWVYESTVPPLTLRGTSALLVTEGRVIAGLANGRLVAVSLADGSVSWETTVAVAEGRSELDRLVDIDADPVLADGVVYAAAYRGRLVAVAAATGRILWSRDVATRTGLAVDAERLYVSGDEGELWALDRRNGAILWKQEQLAGRAITAPALFRGRLVIGDHEGYVHWLAPAEGRFLERTRRDESGYTLPLVATRELLYLTSGDGAVTALAVE